MCVMSHFMLFITIFSRALPEEGAHDKKEVTSRVYSSRLEGVSPQYTDQTRKTKTVNVCFHIAFFHSISIWL